MMVERLLTRTFQKGSLWISLILHILIFLIFFGSFYHKEIAPEKSGLYVPAYLYQKSPSGAYRPSFMAKKQVPVSPLGIEKPIDNHEVPFDIANSAKELISHAKSTSKKSEPIHLIGDNKKTPKPLIKILGQALTASLIYPKSAVDFGIRGVTYVRFLLYPDGHITNIQLIQSSKTGVLDQAALDAVNAISPVKQVGPYLTEPKYIVFGFIFG